MSLKAKELRLVEREGLDNIRSDQDHGEPTNRPETGQLRNSLKAEVREAASHG